MTAQERYQQWLEDPYYDEETRRELAALAGNDEEIQDRFYRELSFGTGGLRGVLGAGTNRMNIYTVRKATQGLANYICANGRQAMGVAIAYDSRRCSDRFAEEAALCMAANGIKAYIFPSLRPTPMLSFALRELKCTAGIVVTASHNPAAYNGYKVYWEDGAQITPPRDSEIIREVNAITDMSAVKTMGRDEALAAGLYEVISPEMDDRYIAALKKLILRPDALKRCAGELKIVYTPLHGTGNLPVRRILRELGFAQVYVVPEQELPDGSFPTVPYPNPEDKRAFALALALAKQKDADLILATDPDADRLGIYAKNSETGEYESFTGNMSGALLLEYELSQRKELGLLPDNGAVVTTIVSGKIARRIAEAYGVELIETLTGFKFIGEQIRRFEERGDKTYLFGYEESYGCLIGTHARDKDAVVAVMALCEAAAYYRMQGLDLCQQLRRMRQTYGCFLEGLCTVELTGSDGAKKMAAQMEALRAQAPKTVGCHAVRRFYDYQLGTTIDLVTGKTGRTTLPQSNVLYYDLTDDAWCCIRPSGTEPKIKLYYGVRAETLPEAASALAELETAAKKLCGLGQ